jgi:hypothetical protein
MELAETHNREVEALNLDLEKHKLAIEKLLKKQEVLAKQQVKPSSSDSSEAFK